jgi:hypothetical protein
MLRLPLQLRFREPTTATVENASIERKLPTMSWLYPLKERVEEAVIVSACEMLRTGSSLNDRLLPDITRLLRVNCGTGELLLFAVADTVLAKPPRSVRFLTPPSAPLSSNKELMEAAEGSKRVELEEMLMDASMDVSRGAL